jgi:hypothetical protein
LIAVNIFFHKNDRVKENEMCRECSRQGEKRRACRILVRKPDGKRPLGRQDLGERIIFKWVLDMMGWYAGLIWFRIGTIGRLLQTP